MQHHGQEAVGTGGIGQGVVLRTRFGKSAVIPGVGQLAVAYRVVYGGAVVPEDMQMVGNHAVAARRIDHSGLGVGGIAMCRYGMERARQLVLGAGVVIGGRRSEVHGEVERHGAVAALGACSDVGGGGGGGVNRVIPRELVAGRGRRVARRGAEDSEVQCAEAVAACGGEQCMGIVVSGAVGAVAERG